MAVPSGCRVESFGARDAEKKVLILDHHGATWEAFTQAYASYLADFTPEELAALKDYCNYHRDNFVPEMAREVAEQILKMQEGVRVDIFSVVDIPRAIVDSNRVNFEGERPAFPPHIAEKFEHMRDQFKQFHFDVQEYLKAQVGEYDLVLDLHSMNGSDLNKKGKEEELSAMKEKDFTKRLKRLVDVGTKDIFQGIERRNNFFEKDGRGEVVGSPAFNASLMKYFERKGFKTRKDKPYHFLSLIFSTRIAKLMKKLGKPYAPIDVNVADIAEAREGEDEAMVHLDPILDRKKMERMCHAIASAICDTLKAAE
ncbi:hypothetical protein KA119_02845 [Candidatus Gracilibacteria bacterium]|nr:hypothetical protein [Candidatus Gracilibacteria bacterium]